MIHNIERAPQTDLNQELVPALIDAVKGAGLVLVSDFTHTQADPEDTYMSMQSGPDGLDGILENNAVLRFSESIDM